jgi:hypothetical protein
VNEEFAKKGGVREPTALLFNRHLVTPPFPHISPVQSGNTPGRQLPGNFVYESKCRQSLGLVLGGLVS